MTSGWNKLMVFLTLVIAISNIFYTHYSKKQFRIMNNQLGEMKRAPNNAEKAFRTEKGAQIAVDNIRWRFIEKAEKRIPFDQICADDGVKKHLCILFEFTNGGGTPASDIHIFAHVIPTTEIEHARATIDALPRPVFGEPEGYQPASAGKHGWNVSSIEEVCNSKPCINTKDAWDMIHKKTPLYIYGIVQYRDIFDGEHITRFCFFQPPYGAMDSCLFGNYMDMPKDKSQH
jgi:hypothetical protein